MKTLLKSIAFMLAILVGYQFNLMSPTDFEGKTITFKTEDNITVTGDLYESSEKNATVILLFHQAGYSRGEYREIAPKLQKMGYTCLAIDQRSGGGVNGVKNQTHLEAKNAGLPTKYVNALPDLEATLNYAKTHFENRKIIVWGSSYSSSLVFILASKYPKNISAILSFSPGEYFTYNNKKVTDYAKKVECPVFVTSAKNEGKSWEAIFAAVPNAKKKSFLPSTKGYHGSKALWQEKQGHEEYWKAVKSFLESI